MGNYNKCSYYVSILYVIMIFPNCAELSSRVPTGGGNIKYQVVHTWADKLGMELFQLGTFITRKKEIQESFKTAQVVPRSGNKLVENMANEIKMMMDLKISAVKRIMDTAENTALSHQNDDPDLKFPYYNAKEMYEYGEPEPAKPVIPLDDKSGDVKVYVPPKQILLESKSEFFNTPVNTSVSSVHIPSNVYDRAKEVIHAIKWSENLDQIFLDNYKKDPTLSWQFFGSSTGFMRQFPASKWKHDPVDLYDNRLRSWYMEAATSPKDMIILLDSSGSMTGQRIDVAKHVVKTILDTLGTNDFVNIFTFGEEVKPVVDCFGDTLVQGTLGNIRELKQNIEIVTTECVANFTSALTKAFEILEQYRTENMGANCNQAIMIISDGAPFEYRDIFEQYNSISSLQPVRVFTYLIGKEIADVREMEGMACNNRGFFVHLSDLAAVREMVLKYIPVMARPLVLGKQDHPVVWSQVYADEVDPKLSDWLWQIRQKEQQKMDVDEYRHLGMQIITYESRKNREFHRRKESWDQPHSTNKYHFMTTVSMPVYDRRENATRIANLLGVAGTDIPIRDIKRMLSSFLLGVNGYAFIVTNNGYILFHPDFRPTFQDILKPAYNSVDMIEVELLDDDRDPRDFNPVLVSIRDEIINQSTGSKWMLVKNHFDSMKRVARIKRQYYWTAIQNTPFTLIITYPESYGINRIQIRTDDDIHRMNVNNQNISSYFSGEKWKIHPEWTYCKDSGETFPSPEMELKYFLSKMSKPGWKWPLSRSSLPPEHTAAMYCDRNLIQSLVFDAKVTEWFSKNTSFNKDDKGNELKQRFGITVAFMATHSGLTRWQEYHSNNAEDLHNGEEFGENNNQATDEVWYQRAVEQYFIKEESFVFSVPFDSGIDNSSEIIVTASHAVFHTDKKNKAPAAVVGFQFKHAALNTLFKNITSKCLNCTKTCSSEDVDCFILDNNGYVVLSPRIMETGRFFGEINGGIMQRLINEKIYKEVVIYDYQAICFEPIKPEENSSSKNLSPLMHLLSAGKFFLTVLLWFMIKVKEISSEIIQEFIGDPEGLAEYLHINKQAWLERITLQRTTLKACDHKRKLYTFNENSSENDKYNGTNGCEKPFVVVPIQGSNLILLVIDTMCPKDTNKFLSTNPEEILYATANFSLACYKKEREFARIRPVSCINKHVNESSILMCGNANSVFINYSVVLVSIILILIN